MHTKAARRMQTDHESADIDITINRINLDMATRVMSGRGDTSISTIEMMKKLIQSTIVVSVGKTHHPSLPSRTR